MLADPIDQYLERLTRRLPGADPRTARVLGEAERDLRAAAKRFESGGWTREEAAAQAIAQYPSVEALAQRFALDAAFAVAVSAPAKTALSLVVGLAGALAVAGLAVVLSLPESGLLERVGQMVVCLAVLSHGAVTLALLWSRRPGMGAARAAVVLGGLAIAAVGGFILVWTLHLSATSGAWDTLTLPGSLLISLQGGLAAWVAMPRIWSPWLD